MAAKWFNSLDTNSKKDSWKFGVRNWDWEFVQPCGEWFISFENFPKFHTKFIIVLNPGIKSYNALNYLGLYYTKIISRNSQTMLSKQKLCQIGETIIQYVHLICFINNFKYCFGLTYLIQTLSIHIWCQIFFCGFLTYLLT